MGKEIGEVQEKTKLLDAAKAIHYYLKLKGNTATRRELIEGLCESTEPTVKRAVNYLLQICVLERPKRGCIA